VDLCGTEEAGRRERIEVLARHAQRSLNLTDGPLLRVIWFDLGEGRPARLLIVAHHLVMDGVSWRILIEDLVTAWEQYRRTGTIDLGPKTMSYRSWSEGLVTEAQKPETAAELDHWRAVWRPGWGALPVDHLAGENDEASADSIALALSADETEALLAAVPAARATVQEVLLVSAARAFAAWTGKRVVVVDLEGHGRESIGGAADVSRTSGWFTCMYPVRLELPAGGGPGETLAQVKEQLRRTPRHGLGYGLLRYLCGDAAMRNEIAALPKAQVGFNYLGQFDQVLRGGGPLRLARESRGEERSSLAKRSHILVITGAIAEGRLQVQWSFSRRLHDHDTIERVAKESQRELRHMIEYCQSPEAEVAAPSDFPLAQLGHRGLEKVLKRVGR
jgi:non-ribosomal peptide synthase protein (TIGR01720 family)